MVKGPFCCGQGKKLAIAEVIDKAEVERLARKAARNGMPPALARRIPAAKENLADTRRAIAAHTCTTTPSVDDLVGVDPGWTGDLSTDDYVAAQRAAGAS